MDTFNPASSPRLSRFVARALAATLLAFAAAAAFAQADPPARVGNLSRIEGSVVYAPAGETEWSDAVVNRPIVQGDRLWTDHDARAEVHLGSSALHLDDESYLDITALDDRAFQASMREGTLNARVRELDAGENFEIDTPHLAFRASQPGDYRIDVDPGQGTTRVTVHQGTASVFGAGGQGQTLQGGQQVTFRGQDLERVSVNSPPLDDGFDRWAADLNRSEDQSIAARYVPRDVVGYQQLDAYGQWADDPTYGPVWYPSVTATDWAPYRYGRWDWIAPWGWTWIDDAPWGFAPFHYGRWAVIRSRWCWVPGRIGHRPVYAPALVAFAGGDGGAGWSLSVGSGPGIGWFPLAPGEAWHPGYRASSVYVRNVNRYIGSSSAATTGYVHQHRPGAWTAVRVDDFQRGRPVSQHWRSLGAADLPRTPIAGPSALPQPRRSGDFGRPPTATLTAPQSPSASVAPRPFTEPGTRQPPGRSSAPPMQERQRPPSSWRDPQFQQQQDTQRQQVENRQRQDAQRQQMEIRQRQDAQRQQQDAQRQQMEIRQRQQQDQARQQQFDAQRQQQAAREQAMRREEAVRQHGVRPMPPQQQQQQQPMYAPQQAPAMAPQQAPRGDVRPQRGWERRQQPQVREENRPQGSNDAGPGRGHGHGGWGRAG